MRTAVYPLALAAALAPSPSGIAAETTLGRDAREPWTGTPKAERYFVGYYRADNLKPGSSLPLDKVVYQYYTHIIHIGLSFDAEGVLNAKKGMMPSQELTLMAHRHGVIALVSLVGNKTNFEKVAADPARLQAFVGRMRDLVREYDYDGIDVDWEHPDSATAGAGWVRLMRALRSMLAELGQAQPRRYWLTTALPAGWGLTLGHT